MVNDEFLVKLMKTLEESNKKTIYEANKQQTEVIKQYIRQEITELKVKLEDELNRKTTELENKYKELQLKHIKLEKELKKNNIIIFGLENPDNLGEYVVDKLNQYLQLNLTLNDISNVYTIGKQKPKKPIIVKLLSYLNKYEILKHCKKLKGTNISIAQDLTFDERNENAILRQHLKKARSKNLTAFIKNRKLIISGQEYSAQDLTNEEDGSEEIILNEARESAFRRNSSAPATPTTIRQEKQQEEASKEDEEVFEIEKEDEIKKKKIGKVSQLVNKVVRPTRANSTKELKITNSAEKTRIGTKK